MDIEVFPNRILGAETTEKILRDLDKIDGIKRTVLQGQRLPPVEMGHPDRRTITVKHQEIDLQVKTGRILMEIEDESVIDEVKAACKPYLPFGFHVYVGKFIRHEKTVTDKIKFGDALEELPEEMVGLSDQNAQLNKMTTIIKK